MQRIAEELARVKELLRQHPQGLSITDIAEKLGKNKHSVGRYLDILHASGHVDLRTFGMAKVYTLSSRIPLSALLSYTTDLVLVVDKNARVLQANDQFLTLIGVEKNQLFLHEIQYIPVPDPAIHAFLAVITEQIRLHQDLEEVRLHTDPNRFYHLRVVPTVFDDGTAGTTAILEDITTERVALDEIRKSREFFEDMIANMTDGLLVAEEKDGEKELLFVNNRFTEITGYSKEEIETMEPLQIAEETEKKRFGCKFKAMADNPSSIQDLSMWSVRKDGESRYLNIRMSSNAYGNKQRYYVLISDMTDKRRRQEQQELQWTIMRRVVDQFIHPIACYRDDETIFLVNTAFCEMFGCTHEEEMAGKHLIDILPSDFYKAFTGGDQGLRTKGGHELQLVLTPCPDGTIKQVPVEKSIVSVGEGGIQYIFGVILTGEDEHIILEKKILPF